MMSAPAEGVLDCDTVQLSCPLPMELTVRSSGGSVDSVHRYCTAPFYSVTSREQHTHE